MNIFFSYGHDDNAVLVEWIKHDLEIRGHCVWIDTTRIKFGDDWRRAITDGIVGSDLVLLFLSKHTTQDPGVCLDEISIALGAGKGIIRTILVESEQEAAPPNSVSHIQWLDMHDWKVHWDRKKNRPLRDNWYEEKLDEIIRIILDPENQSFAGEIDELNRRFDPVLPDTRIGNLLKDSFMGRTWLAEDIDQWHRKSRDSRVFLLTGAPGVGKSAFAAWLTHHNRADIIAAHFIDYTRRDHRDLRKITVSLAFQVATRLPDYRKLILTLPGLDQLAEKSAAELFGYLLLEPLSRVIHGNRHRYVILIDAVDEADDNSLVDIIAREGDNLPPWLSFIITSRPNPQVLRRLSHLEPKELSADDERNHKDMSDFIKEWMNKQKLDLPDQTIAAIIHASEGIFLYLRQFCLGVEKGWIDAHNTEGYPRGMTGIYHGYFKRQFPEKDIQSYEMLQAPLLELMVAAYEPITEELAGKILSLKGRKRINVLDSFESLLQHQDNHLRFLHKSMKDWLTNEKDSGSGYYIPLENGHTRIAHFCWEQYQACPEAMEDYGLKWLPRHLVEIKEYDRAIALLTDFSFMMARVKAGKLPDLLEDYREMVNANSELRNQLLIEEAFFREKAHIMRRGNEFWPSYKILLQLAIEHADDSPLTVGAENFLANGKCDWAWLRKVNRDKCAQTELFEAVFEHADSVGGAVETPDGRILSWGEISTLSFWSRNGRFEKSIQPTVVKGAKCLPDGRLLTWSWWDPSAQVSGKFLFLSKDGKTIKKMEGHEAMFFRGPQILTDGNILSWAGNILRLWSGNGEEIAIIKSDSSMIVGAMGLPDGRICSWSTDCIQLWSKDGKLISTLKGHVDWGKGPSFFPDGRLISWMEKEVFIWDCDGKLVTCIRDEQEVKGAIALPAELILSWSEDSILRLWDERGNFLTNFLGHGKPVRGALEISDKRILSWSDDYTLRLWKRNGTLLKVMEGHTGPIIGAAALPSGRFLSWSFHDNSLRLWSNDGELIMTLKGHGCGIEGPTILSDGRILSWHSSKLYLWDSSQDVLPVLENRNFSRMCGLFPDGRILICGQADNSLQILNCDGSPIISLKGHTEKVCGAKILSDGHILSWSEDTTLRLWNEDGKELAIMKGHAAKVDEVIILPDNRILSWADDFNLILWSFEGEKLTVMKGLDGYIGGVKLLPDGKILTWTTNGDIRLWSNEGIQIKKMKGYPDYISSNQVYGARKTAPIVLPDGHIVWLCGKTIRFFDSVGKLLKSHTMRGRRAVIDCIVPYYGGVVISLSRDDGVHGKGLKSSLWKANGELEATMEFTGHSDGTTNPILLPDGSFIVHEGSILSRKGNWLLLKFDDIHVRTALEHRGSCFILPCQTLLYLNGFRMTYEEARESSFNLDAFVDSNTFYILETHKHRNFAFICSTSGGCVFWHAQDEPLLSELLPDGRALVSSEDKLCILRAYMGAQRITRKELKQLLERQNLDALVKAHQHTGEGMVLWFRHRLEQSRTANSEN